MRELGLADAGSVTVDGTASVHRERRFYGTSPMPTAFAGTNPGLCGQPVLRERLGLRSTIEVVKHNYPYYSRPPQAGPVANTNRQSRRGRPAETIFEANARI